jgi:UDPglucose 6-dehydrogenase
MEPTKICCNGAGYVGGPTMAILAQKCPHIEVVNRKFLIESKENSRKNRELSSLKILAPPLN